MFLTMGILSFPSGFLSVVITLLFFEPPSTDQLNVYFLFWWIMSGAGYLQWFVVVPKLFAKPKLTTLGLQQAGKVEKDNTLECPPRPARKRRARLIRAYDKRGRTPLERAMASNPTDASA